MKKLITTILNRKGEETQIYVFVDDKTAEILLPYKGTEIYHQYVLDEYKMQWGDFREKQHGFSLEEAVEQKGFDIADNESVEEDALTSVYYGQIKNAIATFLTEEQQIIVKKLFVEEKKAADIARELHISRSAISQRISVIYRLLKENLKKFCDQP